MAERARKSTETIESLKVPPFSVSAEQSVIGALMLDKQAFDKVADCLGGGWGAHPPPQKHPLPWPKRIRRTQWRNLRLE